MEIKKIKSNLEDDIRKLTDFRGFLNAGEPHFKVLFGRDSLIVSWQLIKYDPEIAAVTLRTLAKLQAKTADSERDADPGKILHEMWEGDRREIEKLNLDQVPFPYYGSVDSTPLFLIVAWKYLEATDDRSFIRSIWRNILAAKDWIIEYGDQNRDGLYDFQRKNKNGPLNQCWKDGRESPQFGIRPVAPVEVQGYAYEALKSFNSLAEATGAPDRVADDYLKNLKARFQGSFFWPEEKFYYLAIDGDGRKHARVASNPGHLLFTGMIGDVHKAEIVSRLFRADMWTPYGIRTHSQFNPDFKENSYQLGSIWPFDNWIIAEGLRVSGFDKEYGLIRGALLSAYEKLGHIPELYSVNSSGEIGQVEGANHLQAWSSGGLLNLLDGD